MAINFDKAVATMIAKPATRDGIPLFTRVDGLVDHNGGTERVPENSDYARKSRETCTSPDNLKRIFITYNGIYVHLHKPVFGSGKGFDLKREYLYTDKELKNIIGLKLEAFKRGAASASQQIQLSKDTALYGFGLKALRSPFVYQNVEEIYFDWLPLSNYSGDKGSDFSTYLSRARGSLEKAIAMMFNESCGTGVSNVLDRYPRLHTIGYIPMLDGVYRQCDKEKVSNTFDSWMSYAVGSAGDNMEKCILNIRKDKSWVMNWSVKEGIYVFDRDILRPYAEEVKVKFGEKLRKENRDREEASKCDMERTLDRLMESSGSNYVTTLIKVMLNAGEISRALVERDFSESGKRKYGDILTNLGR